MTLHTKYNHLENVYWPQGQLQQYDIVRVQNITHKITWKLVKGLKLKNEKNKHSDYDNYLNRN